MKPLVLMILDGWGIRAENKDNGINLASKPRFDHLWNSSPHTQLLAHGPAVGLPVGIMGNSEVGHMNIGAGRIVFTGLSQIYQAIDNGTFFTNEALIKAVDAGQNTSLHLMGLLSDGAVHSHQDHLYALLKLAHQRGVKNVFVHAFMDGRDTPPQDGLKYIDQLEEQMRVIGVGKIASVSGRFYAMDRDNRWDRVEKAFKAMMGNQMPQALSARAAVEESYKLGKGDEFVEPRVIVHNGQPVGPVKEQDSIIFFNFRADRAREITRAFTDTAFTEFKRVPHVKLSAFTCMAPFDETFHLPVAFLPSLPNQTLGDVISEAGLHQLHIAETEKYAHVTFFFNGGREKSLEGEDRILIPSPREVATYDLKPEMSATKVADGVIESLQNKKHDVIIVNFANPDMVGHTAKEGPIVDAIQVVDACIGRVADAVKQAGGTLVITADHGNAEQMIDENGQPHTAHTLNPVPLIVVSPNTSIHLKEGGRLCDIAPTVLNLMNLPVPDEMTGKSLL